MSRFTRRRLFRLAGGGLTLAALGTRRAPAIPPSAQAGPLPGPALVSAPTGDEALAGDPAFTALIVAWDGDPKTAPAVEVSVLGLDDSWTGWHQLHVDHHVEPSPDAGTHFNPLLQPGLDYRIRVNGIETVDGLRVIAIDTSNRPPSGLLGEQDDEPSEIDLIDGFITPRAGWGADESYRHRNQDPSAPLVVPPRYQDIERVVVHHTATEFGWGDPAAVVRAVYYYHAVVLGWGDIGYNFLIDMYGNVYEGRYGGPNVVGAHARAYNGGSVGIALVGDFTGVWPSEAAQNALVRLISARASHVDPTVAADWIDWGGVPNICGHGDVMPTACPGTDLHATLPHIRGRLAGTGPVLFPAPVLLYDPKLIEFSASPALVDPEGLVEIRARIANRGRNPLITQGPDPGFTYDESEDFDTTGHNKLDNCFRLTVGVDGAGGPPNPYRWGFGTPIANGEEREIVGYIRMNGMGTRRLTASIVREFVRYYGDETASDAVHVVHPLVSRAEPNDEPGSRFVPETGHNVPAAFVRYWEEHGGLARFGFPLTEPFTERSSTDGEQYLTQYFERGRFEYHPELVAVGDEVRLGLLGAESVTARLDEEHFRPIAPFESSGDVVYFPETSHSTSYRFLEYWRTTGGLESYGYPISEKFDEASSTDGRVRLVQYFERARFEYHPDDTWDQQIKLGHLGREVLIRRGWLPGPAVQ